MSLSFKTASFEDLNIITNLANNLWPQYYISIITKEQINYMLEQVYSEKNLVQQMKDGQEFTIVNIDNKPIGYFSFSKIENNNYFLHKFYIDIKNQRKNIGTQTFQYISNKLNTPKTIDLTVNRANYKAINFYFKIGFVIKEIANFDIGNGYFMNDFVMTKKY